MSEAVIEAARRILEDRHSAAGKALKQYPRMSNGLTPDSVKFSPEYRADKAAYDRAFAELRTFNSKHKPKRRK